MAECGRFDDAPFLHQLQPVGDVVVDRALGFAIGIPAVQAAPGLVRGFGLAELAVQLVPVAAHAIRQRHLGRHLAWRIEELEDLLLAHYAALLSSSASASRLAAFGLTSQNLPAKSRKFSSTRALQALPVRRACMPINPVRCWR